MSKINQVQQLEQIYPPLDGVLIVEGIPISQVNSDNSNNYCYSDNPLIVNKNDSKIDTQSIDYSDDNKKNNIIKVKQVEDKVPNREEYSKCIKASLMLFIISLFLLLGFSFILYILNNIKKENYENNIDNNSNNNILYVINR
tara:strand:+ start:477 stop:902 length:426 start_codon:yes stop_codon:yes gene_type:complete